MIVVTITVLMNGGDGHLHVTLRVQERAHGPHPRVAATDVT